MKGNKQITPQNWFSLGVRHKKNCCSQPGGLYSIPKDKRGLLNIIFITNRGAYVCVCLGNTQIGWQGSLATL